MKKMNTGNNARAPRLRRKRSRMGEIWHRIRKNKGAAVGLCILAILVLLLIISFFMPFKMVTGGSGKIRFTAPCWEYPFGTDNQGRNVFYRVIYGTRYSLAIGLGSVAFGLVIGVVAGSYAGYYGGRVDNIILRCSDVLASIPGMLLGMVTALPEGCAFEPRCGYAAESCRHRCTLHSFGGTHTALCTRYEEPGFDIHFTRGGKNDV